MGQSVSNVQYIHLTELQEAAIRADAYMKSLAAKYDENALRQNPQWRQLVLLANSLKDLLPQEVKEYVLTSKIYLAKIKDNLHFFRENREVAFWY